jgi:hypothetical protein
MVEVTEPSRREGATHLTLARATANGSAPGAESTGRCAILERRTDLDLSGVAAPAALDGLAETAKEYAHGAMAENTTRTCAAD